jgi:hypothetical protein
MLEQALRSHRLGRRELRRLRRTIGDVLVAEVDALVADEDPGGPSCQLYPDSQVLPESGSVNQIKARS